MRRYGVDKDEARFFDEFIERLANGREVNESEVRRIIMANKEKSSVENNLQINKIAKSDDEKLTEDASPTLKSTSPLSPHRTSFADCKKYKTLKYENSQKIPSF